MSSIKYPFKIFVVIFIFALSASIVSGQVPDSIYAANIKTIRFHNYGDQQSLPVINLNSNDLKAGTYTYTFIINGKTIDSKKMVVMK